MGTTTSVLPQSAKTQDDAASYANLQDMGNDSFQDKPKPPQFKGDEPNKSSTWNTVSAVLSLGLVGGLGWLAWSLNKSVKNFELQGAVRTGLRENKSWNDIKNIKGFSTLDPKTVYGIVMNERGKENYLKQLLGEDKFAPHAPELLAHANTPKQMELLLGHPKADINAPIKFEDGHKNILQQMYDREPSHYGLITFH